MEDKVTHCCEVWFVGNNPEFHSLQEAIDFCNEFGIDIDNIIMEIIDGNS